MELKGQKVKTVRAMTNAEAAKEGWDNENTSVIEFESGDRVYASRDSEGNGPGSLFGQTKQGQTVGFS